MKILNGNLIDLAECGNFDVIVHGCNCFNTMGAGIAKEIRERYPDAYVMDCTTIKGDISKLGTYTQHNTEKFTIINAYTQYRYGFGASFDYNSFQLILNNLSVAFPSARFGFPLIGCGLAKGDKDRIISILMQFHDKIITSGGNVSLVLFDK